MYEAFSKLVTRVAGQLRVRSALNPILWLAAIVTLPILAQAVKDVNLPTWMIVLAYIPVATAAIGFLYLMIFNPDRLKRTRARQDSN